MPKQSASPKNKAVIQNKQNKPKKAGVKKTADNSVGSVPMKSVGFTGNNVHLQSAWADLPLQTAQRQRLALGIGRVQGNRHFQKMIQRDTAQLEPEESLGPMYLVGGELVSDPLAQYTELKKTYPSIWNRLNKAVKDMPLAGTESETGTKEAAPQDQMTEVSVPVQSLVRPWIPTQQQGDLFFRMWDLVSIIEPDPYAVAEVIQNEILGRWAAQNSDLLAGEVTIRVRPPVNTMPDGGTFDYASIDFSSALQEGPSWLSFSFNGQPIETTDGKIDVLTLDMMGSNNLGAVAKQVESEAYVIGTAGDMLRQMQTYISEQGPFWQTARDDPDAVSLKEVQQRFGNDQFFGLRVSFFLNQHPEYENILGPPLKDYTEISHTAYQAFNDYHDYHADTCNSPELQTMADRNEEVFDEASQSMDEGDTFVGVMQYIGGGLGTVVNWMGNAVTADYYETRRQAIHTFCQGEISYDEMEGIVDAAASRGAIVALVTIGVTLATAGLGGAAVGAGTTVGRTMLTAGVTGSIDAMATTATGSAMTSMTEFKNPAAQKVWGQGKRSVGDILTAGALGFAVGAGGAGASIALGKFGRWLKGSISKPKSLIQTPSEELLGSGGRAITEPPPGWMVEEVSPDLYRFTHSDVPGEFTLTSNGFTYQGAEGKVAQVQFDAPLEDLSALKAVTKQADEAATLPDAKTFDPAIEADLAKIGPINEETRAMLARKHDLRRALVEHPRAARALKLCQSPCLPEHATPNQISKLDELLADMEAAGFKVDDPAYQNQLRQYFHEPDNFNNLSRALNELEQTFELQRVVNEAVQMAQHGSKVPIQSPAQEEVERAVSALFDLSATKADREILLRKVVADYRAVRTADLEHMIANPGQGGKKAVSSNRLTADTLRLQCGMGRDLSAESLQSLTIDNPFPTRIERYQINDFLPDQNHGFSIVTLPDGERYILDPTFAQFMHQGRASYTGRLLLDEGATFETAQFTRNLLRDGFMPLTPENARYYALGLGASENQAQGIANSLLRSEGSMLTEIVADGRVSRFTNTPQVDVDFMDLRDLVPVQAGDISLPQQVDALANTLRPSNPIRNDLKYLKERLDTLAQARQDTPIFTTQ